MASQNVETLRAAHESWNRRDFAGVVRNQGAVQGHRISVVSQSNRKSSTALSGLCWAGMLASVVLVLNLWPRGMLVVCFFCFLSFVSAAQDFSGYQSDGILLEAGFISLFFAPPRISSCLG